ncbi:MAG TPA: DUF4394 domain-containing protein [Solirubrobacteraceae bacterium]|nr:DUF4394 domain-containing protein [Solirubrobacteraceae bacterium]
MLRRHVLVAAAATAAATSLAFAPAAFAESFVAADSANRLYTFDDRAPAKWTRSKPLDGLAEGERIVGLDVRPANRQLFALTNMGRLYVVQRSKARVTALSEGTLSPALSGIAFGFDFNPTVDRIRLVADSGQNLRLNPNTGAVAFTDGTLRYIDGDGGAGIAPVAVASAYTNSVAGATTTTLYDIDSARDVLAIQAPPNEGVLTTVGPLGVNLVGPVSFDISARDGKAYVLARRARFARSRLYKINLGKGTARELGIVSRAPNLVAFATLSKPKG